MPSLNGICPSLCPTCLIGQLALAFDNLAIAFAHIGFGAQQIGLKQLDLGDQLDLVLRAGEGGGLEG